MALDSDIQNPDASLHVTFYSKPVQNLFETNVQGRPIFKDVDFVRIILPGDKNNIIDTFASDDHKRRFPLHWAHYQNQRQGGQEIGTPLSAWPLISAAKAEELRALNFKTVESIAHASDAQLQSLGMAAGMAPSEFRARALRYLQVAKDESFSNAQAEKAHQLEQENVEMKAALAQQQSEMAELKEMVALLAANQKKTPGRKPADHQQGEQAGDQGEAA